MSLPEVAEVVGGVVHDDPEGVTVTDPAGVDSRSVPVGGLFVAVVGEHADGHDYAAGAVAAGAAAVLGSRPCGVPAVVVADPVVALGLLARHVVAALGVRVLAVTGSQGKTGVKDYLAAVLAGVGPTVATLGNNNNELGVPLTALRATTGTEYLVVEMGARGVGHIDELCVITPPDVAAVVNVGTAHVGEFGSRERIALAKGEIVEALGDDGVAVLNADDPLVREMATRTSARVLTFGAEGEVSWRGLDFDALGRPTFELGHRDHWARVSLQQLGAHQVSNAAAAAAMSLAVGVDLDTVATRLGQVVEVSRWRMEPHVRSDGLLVVNDAYNANPESMRSAVQTLGHIKASRAGRTIAVLGEMRELGADTLTGHRSVGESVASARIDVLVTVGDSAAQIADAAQQEHGWVGEAIITASRDEALLWVRENVTATDAVLVKASRGAALERIVEEILAEGAAAR
ncbi:UDP-N-acetylmuramoyl-tripeptide--D-alanyl-D-alanine ligase [Nocardioides gilvus]|uniref:UDP-N-acetylmuramoyl-tripeptide--D-alanyl-D- alanine ligase n=1 Tax=Nocardioides gilvus TaxID=1735589 RepID=UPI001EF50FFE|nr:UDP-N-acetylmuramoyl-tripeptide--D-alanyl-D-alanine ligase [Nocardioides gilvus]